MADPRSEQAAAEQEEKNAADQRDALAGVIRYSHREGVQGQDFLDLTEMLGLDETLAEMTGRQS